MKMKKIDVILALIIGEVIGWLFYTTLVNLHSEIKAVDLIFQIKYIQLILAIVFPFLTVFVLWFCWFLGKKFIFIFQAAKYALIGVFATLVDLGVMNFLSHLWSVQSGDKLFLTVKGISFVFATCSKFIGDKFWAFEKMEKEGMKKEFLKFFLVTLVGLAINVWVANDAVRLIGPQLAIPDKILQNIAGIVAAIGAAIWNFFAYKFIVFKK